MIPKVSILVPVYNVSAFIERCANSVFSQTFTDIEYIFVNDNTPDDSIIKLEKVIEKYPDRKKNVRIIQHQINKGIASARNTAINAAHGEYIAFVDSDDFIENSMIESLYFKAKKEDADIVISNYMLEYSDKSVVCDDYLSENNSDHIGDLIQFDRCSPALWNKLIKRELYDRNDCRVPDGLNYYDDRHIIVRLFFYAKKIVKVDEAFYHYVQYNTNSITKSNTRMHFENVIAFWSYLELFFKEHKIYDQYKSIIGMSKIQNKAYLLFETDSYAIRKEFANMFDNEEIKTSPKLRNGDKLMLNLVKHKQFALASLLRKIIALKNIKHKTTL